MDRRRSPREHDADDGLEDEVREDVAELGDVEVSPALGSAALASAAADHGPWVGTQDIRDPFGHPVRIPRPRQPGQANAIGVVAVGAGKGIVFPGEGHRRAVVHRRAVSVGHGAARHAQSAGR